MKEVVVSGNLPGSVDEFIILSDELAVTPEGGAASMVIALSLYCREKSDRFLAPAVHKDRLQSNTEGFRLTSHDLQLIRTQTAHRPWLPSSYFTGTSPANAYTIPPAPYRISVSEDPYSSADVERRKVFVTCSGADSPRPVTLKKTDSGLWKAVEWSSLLVGIRPPE